MTIQNEIMVIGSLLTRGELADNLRGLKAEHFQDAINRIVFQGCMDVIGAGLELDVISLGDRLKAIGRLDDVGGYVGLNDFCNMVTSGKNFGLVVSRVIESGVRSRLLHLLEECASNLRDTASPFAVGAGHIKAIEGLLMAEDDTGPRRMNDCIDSYIGLLERRMSGQEKRMTTGLKTLDDKLGGGFAAGDLVVVAARPAMGKTAFSMTAALAAAQTGDAVVFFSLEMAEAQLIDRAVSNIGQVSLAWLQKPGIGREHDENWTKANAAHERLYSLGMHIDDRPAATLADIRMKSTRVKRQNGGNLGLIVVDYLGLMSGGNPNSRVIEIGEYSRGLKNLAKELQCPVLLLAQLNRGLEQRTNKRPLMSDLRDSGEVEQDADTMILLYRDEVYDEQSQDKGIAELIVAKQRQGTTGTVYCTFRGEFTRFDDLPYGYQRPKPQPKGNGKKSLSGDF